MCGTKNFASVRLYSAPQLHWTIVAILGICAYGTPKQAESAATIKLIHDRRLGAKPHESSASGGYNAQPSAPNRARRFIAHNYFEVKGCHAGKRYRIRHGMRTNVYELDAASRPRAGWCFVPKDNLVAGDVMLAQKFALATDERARWRWRITLHQPPRFGFSRRDYPMRCA